jgi:hypothetical protein
VGNLALLLALLALTACGAQAVSPPAPAAGLVLPTSALTQEQINASALRAQETATADVLQAQQRATADAAASTHSVALTREQVNANALQAQETATADVLQAQQRATVNAATSTQSAGTTATQQKQDERVAGTTTAVAGAIAAGTQSAVATAQQHADQVRESQAEQQRTIAFLWTWGPPLFLLAVVALCLWAFWYWEIRRRTIEPPVREPRAPAAPNIRQRLDELPPPKDPVIIDHYRLTAPDGQVSEWMEEVKDKLLASTKDDDGNPDA